MKDFDQFFADDLSNGGEFRPSNDGWQRIAERLDTEGGRTVHVRTYWLISAGILILLGMGGYIFHLQQELKAIKNEISALKNSPPVRAGFTPAPNPDNQIPLINDNTHFSLDRAGVMTKTRAEVMTETKAGVMTETRAEVMTETKAGVMTKARAGVMTETKAGVMTETKAGVMTETKAGVMTEARAEVNPAPDINDNAHFSFDRAGVNPAPTATATPHPVSSINRPARPEAPSYPLPPLTKPHKTHNWQFGLAAQVYGGSIKHDVWSAGVGLGGALQYALTRHLNLTGDISLLKNEYFFDDRQHTDLPIPQPPSPDYRWHGAVGRQWGAEAGIGLKYQFRPDKRNKPYLSMGFAGNYGSDVRIHHIFENPQTEKNLKIEDEAIQRDNVKLLFKPALGYTAKWRRATWNIELFGRISPHEKSRESFHQTGIRLERIF